MKKIIVTGSNGGFGLLTVRKLAKQEHIVCAAMRNIHSENKAAAISIIQWAKDNIANVRIIELDVTSDVFVN